MKIESVQVELLKVPANMLYEAAGHSVSHNWHILSRIVVEDGTEGIGWLVNTRPAFIYPLYEATKELGDLLVGENVYKNEYLYLKNRRLQQPCLLKHQYLILRKAFPLSSNTSFLIKTV